MRASTVKHLAALAAISVCALAPVAAAQAQDAAKMEAAKAGRAKAQTCAVCHGLNGIATQPDSANLAGQSAFYLSEQLKKYRSGERKHEVMSMMAKPLTDDDIEALSQWFASMKIEVKVPK
jgi:cytochrome c553